MNPKNNNILSFVVRYWKILICHLVSIALVSNDHIYGIFGTLLYLPVIFTGAVIAALLVRFVFFFQTLDEDAHSGYFVSAWKRLDERTRVIINLSVLCVLIISASIIGAGLIR